MIFGVAVDLPEIVELRIGQNIFYTQHRSHHGVILIVVFVHAVAAHEVQVGITRLQFLPNRGDVLRVIVVVNRIGFFLSHNAAIEDICLKFLIPRAVFFDSSSIPSWAITESITELLRPREVRSASEMVSKWLRQHFARFATQRTAKRK